MSALPVLFELTWFALLTHAHAGRVARVTADALARWFTTPRHSARHKRDLPLWCAARFEGNQRAKDHVRHVTAFGFDFDACEQTLASVVGALPCAAAGHTTWSHGTKPGNCFRVVLPIDRPATPTEHERLWAWFAEVFAGLGVTVDPKAKDPSRAWFVPCARDGYESAIALEREVLDVDEALTLAPRLALVERARQMGGRPFVPPPERAPVLERARRYLAHKDPSIAGSGGHDALLSAAVALVRGFALTEREALELLRADFNPRCKPPWSTRDLERKVREATKAQRVGLGYLLEAQRRNA